MRVTIEDVTAEFGRDAVEQRLDDLIAAGQLHGARAIEAELAELGPCVRVALGSHIPASSPR